MKFYIYNFMKQKPSGQIVEEIGRIAEATKGYDHEEEMMFFALVPHLALERVMGGVDRRQVKIGAQNVSLENDGSITGETTLSMLKGLDVDLVLAGATDRRQKLGETDEEVAQKHLAILQNGLKAMVCVDAGADGEEQVRTAFRKIPEDAFYRTGVVYQPLLPVGGGGGRYDIKAAGAQIERIRAALAAVQPAVPEPLPVFCGGQMTPQEGVAFLQSGLADGIFVDDRLWDPDTFVGALRESMGR